MKCLTKYNFDDTVSLLCSGRICRNPDTKGYYNAFASIHDEYAEAADWPAKSDVLVGRAIGFMATGAVKDVLDLGAGTGLSIAATRNHARPSRIVAVDASAEMLAKLRARHEAGEVETVVSDIRDYVAACDETFDLITSMSALEFVPDLPDLLKRMTRLLNENGVFAATYIPQVPGSDERSVVHESPDIGQSLEEFYWTPEEIEGSLTSSGLDIVARDHIPAYEVGDVRVGAYNFVIARKPAE